MRHDDLLDVLRVEMKLPVAPVTQLLICTCPSGDARKVFSAYGFMPWGARPLLH